MAEINQMASEIFYLNWSEKAQQRDVVASLTIELQSKKRPLPAPRFSQRNVKKMLKTSKAQRPKLSLIKNVQLERKINDVIDNCLALPHYDTEELKLMEDIEKEFANETS